MFTLLSRPMLTTVADTGNTPFSIMPPVTAPSNVLHYLQQDVSELIKLERLRSIDDVAQMSLVFHQDDSEIEMCLIQTNQIPPHRLLPLGLCWGDER